METSEYSENNEKQLDKIENQLTTRIVIIFTLLGLSCLFISGILFFLDIKSYPYWGELSNSIAFEIFGVVLMYRFIGYLIRSDKSDNGKNSKTRMGLGIIGIIVAFWIYWGVTKQQTNLFADDILLNISVEFGGALSLYFLFDQFIELIQKPRQQLNNHNNQQRDKEFENLRKSYQELMYQLTEYESYISELKTTVHKYTSLETRVIGVLSENKSHSRDDVLRIINTGIYGNAQHSMSDIQSILGKLTNDGRIFSDRYGEYFKKDSADKTQST